MPTGRTEGKHNYTPSTLQPPLIGGIHTVRLLARPPHPALNQLLVLGGNLGLLLLGHVELHLEGQDVVLDLAEQLGLDAQLLALVADADAQGVALGRDGLELAGLRLGLRAEVGQLGGGLAQAGVEVGGLAEGGGEVGAEAEVLLVLLGVVVFG